MTELWYNEHYKQNTAELKSCSIFGVDLKLSRYANEIARLLLGNYYQQIYNNMLKSRTSFIPLREYISRAVDPQVGTSFFTPWLASLFYVSLRYENTEHILMIFVG